MARDFKTLMKIMRRLHSALMAMTPVLKNHFGRCDYPGVYLFSEDEKYLYVGRSKNLQRRIPQHSRPSVKDAPFAFRLTREVTGNTKATYAKGSGRKALLKKVGFIQALAAQKQRIAKMRVRYVRVDDATTQALLEIYSSPNWFTLLKESR